MQLTFNPIVKHVILLRESLGAAKQRFLETGKIKPEDFNRLANVVDITPTKKYLEKVCQWFLDEVSNGAITDTNAFIIDMEHFVHAYDILCNRNLIGKMRVI